MSAAGGRARGPGSRPRLRADRLRGIAMVLVATVAWSFSGLYTRLLHTEVFAAIAWRCFFGASFLLPAFLVVHRGNWRRRIVEMGWPGIVVVLLQVVTMAATVGGLYFTIVANVTVIYSASPFLAGAFGWWLSASGSTGARSSRARWCSSAS